MSSNPANEQVNVSITKSIFTNHTALVASNIKYYPVASVAEQVSGAKGSPNIGRRIPIGILRCSKPIHK
jgi:hypothetical protein